MTSNSANDKVAQTFTPLPLDVLIVFMDYLDPRDLIALRKTCRTLYDASQQRIVWIRALTDVCHANNVFLPTFQFDQMTTEELLRAATAPSRWLASVKKSNCQQAMTQASGAMPLEPPALSLGPVTLALSPNDDVQNVFLVPGGRFAFVLTLHSLQLWDLNAVPRGGEKKNTGVGLLMGQLLAAVTMDQQYNVTLSIQPTKDGMGLRVAVPSIPIDSAAAKQIAVYETFPLDARPTMNRIALLAINSTAASIVPRLAGDLIIFLDGKTVKVWDFVNDLRAEWNTQKNILNNVFVTSDAVLLLSHEETIVWKIPGLKPFDQEPTATTEEDVRSFPSLLGGWLKMTLWGALDDWYWNTRESFLDIFFMDKSAGKATSMSRYQLASPSPPSSNVGKSTEPSLSFRHSPGSDVDISNLALQYRCCEGDLVACSISSDAQLGYVSISGGEPRNFARVTVKLKHDMTSIVAYSICPLAGRVCYVTEENEIHVADLSSVC
ncbi:hypothetical protein P691DRAFT_777138 [Macrolepiota fuliginosa MF-IS2]|uniref:F-box domain-containing protein n=1 Tax=Macrolepiota fuliginosa MF-IS2 TaxID=1400762 RepID=A0A9P5X9Y8_9AGAR|nr:hypothetical protein P691DRAFT_777138 [Macrolepiota fuliginosa MF-IS2]